MALYTPMMGQVSKMITDKQQNPNEIGMIYLGTLIWAILAWGALRLIESSEDII